MNWLSVLSKIAPFGLALVFMLGILKIYKLDNELTIKTYELNSANLKVQVLESSNILANKRLDEQNEKVKEIELLNANLSRDLQSIKANAKKRMASVQVPQNDKCETQLKYYKDIFRELAR